MYMCNHIHNRCEVHKLCVYVCFWTHSTVVYIRNLYLRPVVVAGTCVGLSSSAAQRLLNYCLPTFNYCLPLVSQQQIVFSITVDKILTFWMYFSVCIYTNLHNVYVFCALQKLYIPKSMYNYVLLIFQRILLKPLFSCNSHGKRHIFRKCTVSSMSIRIS